ncbi:MAG TPA: hypothetical protein PLU93_09990 [Treponemataceae bacterium]|jgi:hypothetical protein|nr:hypothetical protein [Treponemataceae bacterium]
MSLKAMDLFEAYVQNKLPMDEGYIVTSYFKPESTYSIYEIVSYSAVKDIYASGNGLTFQTNGKKLYILVEPSNYNHKTIEPYCRAEGFQIPLRFSEANIITAKNQSKIIFNKEAQQAISAFTILKPEGINFAFLFFSQPGVFDSMNLFFSKTLNQEAGIPQADATKASKAIADLASKTLTWPKDQE